MADRPRLPKVLSAVRTLMFVQSILGIAGGVFFVLLVALFGAGGGGAGLLAAFAVISTAVAVTLLACAILLPRRLPRVRVTAVAVEGVIAATALIGILIGLADGSFPLMGIVPLAFSVPVLMNLLRRDVHAWFVGDEAALP